MGTRLRPLTLTCPKPLLPIGNLPIITRIILSLRKQNIREFLFLLHYQPEAFIKTLGSGEAFDAKFKYEVIAKDLSTAGSVKHVRDQINETCLVYSADILAELPVAEMYDFHRRNQALVTLALYPMPAPLPFGIVKRNQAGRILRFLEKPTWPQVFSDWINASIYVMEPELLDHIPENGRPVLFEHEVFPPLAKAGERIFGFPLSGFWRDVGTPEDLRRTNMDYLAGRLPESLLTPEEVERLKHPDLRTAGAGSSTASFIAGAGSVIDPSAQISDSVLGVNCQVAAGARIRRSVLLRGARVAEGAQIEASFIMDEARIEAMAVVQSNCLIGKRAELGAACLIQANGMVRPEQRIVAGSTVAAKRVLPIGDLRKFVDGGSLLGSTLGSFKPEFMQWLGRAFAVRQICQIPDTTRNLKKRLRAILHKSRQSGKAAALLLATASPEGFGQWSTPLAQGMVASGCKVHCLQNASIPIARFLLRANGYLGGIYLGMDDLSGMLRLVLMHADGEDFTTSESCSLERLDFIEDAYQGGISKLDEALAGESYLKALLETVFSGEAILPLRGKNTVIVHSQAVEWLVHELCARTGWELSTSFCHTSVNPGVSHAAEDARLLAGTQNSDLTVWIGSNGERLKLLLPDVAPDNFGVSDLALARLLYHEQVQERKLLIGWLMPEPNCEDQIRHRENLIHLSSTKWSYADLNQYKGSDGWYAFDGNGGIAVSEWLRYPDALMALSQVFRRLSTGNDDSFQDTVRSAATSYRSIPCHEESKARVMRRLVEKFDDYECELSDGVKLKAPSGWIVIRPCAGRDSIEVFKCEHTERTAAPDSAVKMLYDRVLDCVQTESLKVGS